LRIIRNHTIALKICGSEINRSDPTDVKKVSFHMVRTLEIEVNQKNPDNIPLILGANVQSCPVCGHPLSFAYGNYFCRNLNCPNYRTGTSEY
jgi:hypothetical protein